MRRTSGTRIFQRLDERGQRRGARTQRGQHGRRVQPLVSVAVLQTLDPQTQIRVVPGAGGRHDKILARRRGRSNEERKPSSAHTVFIVG